MEWLLECCSELGFRRETFHLAVLYFDQYLSTVENVKLSYAQMFGVTALQLAVKFEETDLPPMRLYEKITSYTYTSQQIVHAETLLT